MNFRTSALILFVLFAFVAMPLAVNIVFAQPTQAPIDFTSYDSEPTADGGETTPQGIPIDCPGGPT
jgi:hypothetical protein